MCKTMSTIISDDLFPYALMFKFQFNHKSFYFSFCRLMIMPFSDLHTVRNYIFPFSHKNFNPKRLPFDDPLPVVDEVDHVLRYPASSLIPQSQRVMSYHHTLTGYFQ